MGKVLSKGPIKQVFKPVLSFPCRDINQLYESVKAKALKLQQICLAHGLPIVIIQTYRSYAYQDDLHKANPDGATAPGLSMHEFRCAFDVMGGIKGKEWDIEYLEKVGELSKQVEGLTWGGNFKHKDRPHYQYTGEFTEHEIRMGKIPA